MKVSQRADDLRLVLKQHTALDLCRFQVVEGRWTCAASRSSRVRKEPLATPSFESGHNRSQGCSSGE